MPLSLPSSTVIPEGVGGNFEFLIPNSSFSPEGRVLP
jgi:hypothetical protein